jgi:hypothetical protein
MYTLADHIESRRRVSNLRLAFVTALDSLGQETRAQLTKDLEELTSASPEEFVEAFVGWLTEDRKKEPDDAAKIKRTKKTS